MVYQIVDCLIDMHLAVTYKDKNIPTVYVANFIDKYRATVPGMASTTSMKFNSSSSKSFREIS